MKAILNKNYFEVEYQGQKGFVLVSDEKIKSNDYVYYLHNSGLHKPSVHIVIKPNYSDYKPYSIHFTSGFGVKEDCKKIVGSTFPLEGFQLKSSTVEDNLEFNLYTK